MSKVSLFIFRHGETDWNREGRMQGSIDVPLNELGKEQAEKLRGFFSKFPVDGVLSSDLSRAKETTQIVFRDQNLPIIFDQRLRETKLGDAESLTPAELEMKFGKSLLNRWRSIAREDAAVRFPNGESKAEHPRRLLACLQDHLDTTGWLRVAVSTHGGAMRRLIHNAKPELMSPVLVGNCVTYEFTYHRNEKMFTMQDQPVFGEAMKSAYTITT